MRIFFMRNAMGQAKIVHFANKDGLNLADDRREHFMLPNFQT